MEVSVVKMNMCSRRVIYVGRPLKAYRGASQPLPGHPLANPFFCPRGAPLAQRQECLGKYCAWLDAHPERDRLLADLAETVRRSGLPLACWCCKWSTDDPGEPPVCHAVELALRVKKLLEAAR